MIDLFMPCNIVIFCLSLGVVISIMDIVELLCHIVKLTNTMLCQTVIVPYVW